jgi:uncharacterized protein YkwD
MHCGIKKVDFMKITRRRHSIPIVALTLMISFLSASCVFPYESLGLWSENTPQEDGIAQVQLSPPPEILPDNTHNLEAALVFQQVGQAQLEQPESATPFLPLDPSVGPTITSTPSMTATLPSGTLPITPTDTATPNITPTVTHTATITPTLPPGTQPITPTNTATRTITPTLMFTPTHTYTASPTNTQQSSPPPPPTATDTPAPTAPPSCDPSGNGSFESALIELINQERQSHGLGTLSSQSQLTTAARNHSADMACNSFFSHTGSDGSLPWDRVTALGYSYSAIAENIFAGSSSAQTAFDAWMNSPGHRDNMLNPDYTEIGVGYRYWATSPYSAYTTAVFTIPR